MQTAIRVSLEHLFRLLDILYFYIIDICLSTSISEIWDFFFHLSDLHAFFTSKAPELMTDFVIEAQRLQQSAAQNNTTQSSIDTTDHPEPRFVNFFILLFWVCFASNIYYKVEVMETEEFNEDSFETETNNLMEDEQDNSPSQKLPEKVKAKKKATRNSRKSSKKTSAAEVVLSSDDDDTGKPDDPDYKPRMRTRSKSKKNAWFY